MSIRVVTAHETDRVRARDPEFFAAACGAVIAKRLPALGRELWLRWLESANRP